MKKILFSIAIIAALASCKCHEFTVNGTIAETDLTKGAVIVMQDNFTGQRDTAMIVDGKFTFKGIADPTSLKTVLLATQDRSRNMNFCTFIAENGKIVVDLDSAKIVKAGPLTNAYIDYQKAIEQKSSELYQKVSSLTAASEEEREAVYNEARKELDEINDQAFAANKDNAIGLAVVMGKIYDFESVAELDSYIADAADFIKNNEMVAKTRAALEALDNTSAGKAFADFKGTDAAGNEIALSTFVGKGKYVLVDFWASWCGPCRREIPNLIKIHEKYGRQIVVLGVPVWDQREGTDNAIKDMGIKYDQIFVGDDKTPTELYGIQGIPQIILFAPDGTIAKRDLRGDKIEAAIVEALKK